jgi:uncharacterized protein (DUF2126 family)
MAQVPHPGGPDAPLPWLVDRLFRNLLTDVTGNTHRSEICIDKLFSPDGPTGRLGLVEFRGFEMPPNARMSLAQQLLIRALIARSGRTRSTASFVRWGTSLHDRFMLPHYVWQDFSTCSPTSSSNGFEFRSRMVRGPARIPLPVLRRGRACRHQAGAAPGAGTLACHGRTRRDRRHRALCRFLGRTAAGQDRRAAMPGAPRVTCNGRIVPMKVDRQPRSAVAGVRFKAWQPASGLHPALPVNTPLTFDIYDRWSGVRSAAASIMSPIPAGAIMTPSRSMATRRKLDGSPASKKAPWRCRADHRRCA